MKHKLLPTIIGAVLAAGMGAAHADITVFGHIDTAIVSHDTDMNFLSTGKMPADWAATTADADDVNFVCTTCSIGFRGSEDLGNGLKAIFNLDFQYDTFDRNKGNEGDSLTDRDQWLGLAGNFGQVRWGTISTGYKSHGAMIDPLYRTAVQGRGVGLQSFLHLGAGEDGEGRAEHTVRWDSPDWNGVKVTAHYTLDSDESDGIGVSGKEDDDAYGIGAQYKNGGILMFVDYLTNDSSSSENSHGDLSAWKVGGKYTLSNFAVMGQYEDISDDLVNDEETTVWHVAGSYTMGNNLLYLGYGQSDMDLGSTVLFDPTQDALTVAGMHSLSKRTSAYAAYSNTEQDLDGAVVDDSPEKDIFAVGLKHKF